MSHREQLAQFDWLRVTLFPIGIFLHSFFNFSLYNYAWWSSSFNPGLHYLVWLTHLFRIPLFMLIAGYFSEYSFERESVEQFLLARMRRIFLPLVLGYLVLLPPLHALLYERLPALDSSVQATTLSVELDHAYQTLLSGQMPPHYLWFLVYLLCYTALFAATKRFYVGRRLIPFSFSFLFALGTGVCAATLWHAGSWWDVEHVSAQLMPLSFPFLYYGFFFMSGTFLRRSAALNQRVTSLWRQLGGIAMVGFITLSFAPTIRLSYPNIAESILVLLVALSMMAATFGIYGFYWQKMKIESSIVRSLAGASLWVYVVHAPILCILAYCLGPLIHNECALLAVLFVLTTSISLFTYYLKRQIGSLFTKKPLFLMQNSAELMQ